MMPVDSPLPDPCGVGPVWGVCATGNGPRTSGRSVPSLGGRAGQGRGIELVDAGGNGRSAPAASHALAMGRGIGVRGDDRLWHATATGTARDLFAGDLHGSHKSMIGADNIDAKNYEVVIGAAQLNFNAAGPAEPPYIVELSLMTFARKMQKQAPAASPLLAPKTTTQRRVKWHSLRRNRPIRPLHT